MNKINLLVSDSNGIYVPQVFATQFDLSLWNNIDPDDIAVIEKGPGEDWYWDSWQNILESASYVHDGRSFTLHQDGDLWAIAYDELSEEEKSEFFGD